MYSMYRERDGAGDSGNMSTALWINEEGHIMHERDARPRVGVAMRVGSAYARTMSAQDWWQTTLIGEILEESKTRVRFRTMNGSIYTWECRDEAECS